jgi:hypothetical protein
MTPASMADLFEPVVTAHGGLRPGLRSVEEALGMIDCDIAPELHRLPCWTFARALLIEARRSGKKRDVMVAVRQLRQALSNEGWLKAERRKPSARAPARP